MPWSGVRETIRLVVAHRRRLAIGAATLALGALVLRNSVAWLPAALPVLANLAGSWRFAATLRPGREPLITRYTRFDSGGCPAEVAEYSRGLTLLWAWFLGLFALGHAAALAGPSSHALVLAAEVALGLALFVGEHAVRNRRFPHHGRATPGRTLRAVRLAHQAPAVAPAGAVDAPLAGRHAR